MKLIESSAEYLPQQPGLEGLYKQIEIAGRTCYKSEDKITSDSAEKFVHKMMESHHNAMLEHGTVYLKMPITDKTGYRIDCYHDNPYSKIKIKEREYEKFVYDYYITTNLRVLTENGWLDDLQFLCDPIECQPKRISIKLVTSIGIVRELLRHRVFSFANESTRYCNYSKAKFGDELTFIIPSWANHLYPGHYERPLLDTGFIDEWLCNGDKLEILNAKNNTQLEAYGVLLNALWWSEGFYMHLTKGENVKLIAQQAREVLPLCTKSEIVMTGFESDWKEFLDLRLYGKTGEPHPDMKILAGKISVELKKIIKNEG